MSTIGIVGAGIGGLQLGLYLQQHGVKTVIYSDKTAEQMLNSRLPSTPARFPRTIERERELKVNHWDSADLELRYADMYVSRENPLAFRAELTEPGSFVDSRWYCSKLLEDFQQRGGQVVIGTLTKDDVAVLSEGYDLVVMASGRGSMIEMFERLPEYSPYVQPQRYLAAAYYHGVTRDPHGMNFVIVPGHGEIFQATMCTHEGLITNMVLEGIPGRDFDSVTKLRYEENPAKFNAAVLEVLRHHAPPLYANIDPEQFRAVGPQHVLQGAITPTVRRAYADLGNGKFAVAIGDVHVVNDPIVGQGANTASQSAWTLGEEILSHAVYDEAFCKETEQKLLDYALAVTNFSNAFLQPPPPHVADLLESAAHHKAVATGFIDGFTTPKAMWEMLSNPANTEAFVQERIVANATVLTV